MLMGTDTLGTRYSSDLWYHRAMPETPLPQPNNPLHGKTLQVIMEFLVERYGWEALGSRIDINCFQNDPSVASSLKFLRKTPWARAKVEALYLATLARDGASHTPRE